MWPRLQVLCFKKMQKVNWRWRNTILVTKSITILKFLALLRQLNYPLALIGHNNANTQPLCTSTLFNPIITLSTTTEIFFPQKKLNSNAPRTPESHGISKTYYKLCQLLALAKTSLSILFSSQTNSDSIPNRSSALSPLSSRSWATSSNSPPNRSTTLFPILSCT